MKKILLLLIIALLFVACSSEKIDTKITSDEIIKKFKESGLKIGKIEKYTADTDPNKLLGRPNQYISKINWEDTNIEQPDGDILGGTIEIFNNSSDLKKRKEYLEKVTGSASILTQYIYSNSFSIMRLDKDLTPSEAEKYKKIFESL